MKGKRFFNLAKDFKSPIAHFLEQEAFGVSIALILLIVVFSLFSPDFMTFRTWGSITTFGSVLGTVALGVTLLMIAGEFDLSIGSTSALCGMLFAMGLVNWNINPYIMGFIALALGAAIGLLNGLITLWTGIPSFITTLGAMLVWRGAVLAISQGFPITLVEERQGVLLWFGTPLGEGFHTAIFWWLSLAGLFSWLLVATPFGNHIFATGGDPVAAKRMGVNVSSVKLICFTLCGALASLTGIILFSQLQDLSPTAGENYELYAITCAVIGGTALTGGSGTILGTLFGTVLIGVVQAGLVHMGIDSYWFRTFVGVLLVLAVILNLRLKFYSRGRTA